MASPHQQKVSSTYKPSSSEANLCSNDGASKYKSAFSFHVSQKKENPISSDQEWQDVINLILTAPSEASILSERLAFLLQEFPLEGQVEAAHHMVNLLSDIDYYTAERVFLDKHLPHQVHRVVFEDLLSRPNYIKLPVLVKVVRDFSHPLHREALENLRVLTGKDKGFIELQSWDLIVREFLDKKLESHQ